VSVNRIVERVGKLLVAPSEEWEVIKAETPTVVDLFTRYVMVLAAIPAVASFFGWSLIGYSAMGTTYRVPLAAGLANAVITYLLTLASVYAMALIIDFVAGHYQGERDFMQALKIAAYFPTSWWVAGIFSLMPSAAILSVVGGLHSLWILWTGVGPLMQIPEDRRPNYTGVIVLAAILLTIITLVVGMPLATPSNTP
jgi:hypothetical protein